MPSTSFGKLIGPVLKSSVVCELQALHFSTRFHTLHVIIYESELSAFFMVYQRESLRRESFPIQQMWEMTHWWIITEKFRWEVIHFLFCAENIKEGIILDSWEQRGIGRLIICVGEHWQECASVCVSSPFVSQLMKFWIIPHSLLQCFVSATFITQMWLCSLTNLTIHEPWVEYI